MIRLKLYCQYEYFININEYNNICIKRLNSILHTPWDYILIIILCHAVHDATQWICVFTGGEEISGYTCSSCTDQHTHTHRHCNNVGNGNNYMKFLYFLSNILFIFGIYKFIYRHVYYFMCCMNFYCNFNSYHPQYSITAINFFP